MAKKFVLPSLPYDYSALEPVISAEIMRLHHQKHHNAYVTQLNAALEKYEQAQANDDLETMVKLQSDIQFNGGGHLNHSLFWVSLAPKAKGGGEPPQGELLNQINRTFGSFNHFIDRFNEVASSVKGSGWAWLGLASDSKILTIAKTSNHDLASSQWNMTPLLVIDVWEHAYYLQYKNARSDFLKAIWQVVNWASVTEKFEKALDLAAAK